MKTTYVITQSEINNFKLDLNPKDLVVIDYFIERQKLIRWYKESPDEKKGKFFELKGLIDISFYRTISLPPEKAKEIINRKNVEYLVRRKFVGSLLVKNVNKEANIYKVRAENVKEERLIFEEYHLVFDEQIEDNMLFPIKDWFFGNLYDYIKQREVTNRNTPIRGLESR